MKKNTAASSLSIMTEIVLPNDTNNLNNLFGGQLLSWMDRCAAISAHRHCRETVVTATVNHVSFKEAIPQGSIVTLEAKVSRAFRSSMEIFIDVYTEDKQGNGEKTKCNEAIYTFVAVNSRGKTVKVPPIIPQTELEKQRYDAALRRRQLSLVLAGKLSPKEATELKALFD